METRNRRILVDGLEHPQRRDDVEHYELLDPVRVIEGEAMGNSSAAVMADHGELPEAELLHDLDLVERHRALGIAGVIFALRRLAAVP
jgi:hypothetical protein